MENINSFFTNQLAAWPDCNKRYADLREAHEKCITVDGREYRVSFNPARMRSATAKVSNGKVDRPCFLCRSNRPAEQTDIDYGRYSISVNPFPICDRHFTIINNEHARQEITPDRLCDMEQLAKDMPGYLIFFNGACSGASAPDHFHFQAVPQKLVPLTTWNQGVWKKIGVQQTVADNLKIELDKSDFCNIICWQTSEGKTMWWVVNRRCHRPWQYSAEGEERVLISPASLEFAGVVPLAREEDFIKMDSHLLEDVLNQCWNREPLVDVGVADSRIEAQENTDGTKTLHGVRIGIGFHWDQHRDFRYEGDILYRRDPETEKCWTINRLKIEQYLKSVIQSEMSATSSLQLLKAHAVISRSWLMFGSAPHTLFDVCSDDCCQRYQGISDKMNPVVEQAIEETRGEVLEYDGEICDARYSKCCGGVTEEFRYCWENLNIPYLQSVADSRPDGTVFCDTENAAVLKQVLNDYDQQTRNFYHWQVEYTQDELSQLVEEKLHKGLGRILNLEPLERGKSGRISLLRITGENGSIEIGKELAIRKALSPTCLYSSNFEVKLITSNNSSLFPLHSSPTPLPSGRSGGGSSFRLIGTGWGHGVGLCQIGAAVMGAEGYDYKEILSHYYKNAEIKKIW